MKTKDMMKKFLGGTRSVASARAVASALAVAVATLVLGFPETAQADDQSATIAFDAGGGVNPPAPITDKRVGETFTYPAVGDMARAGYTFRFWVDGNGYYYDPYDESATICGAYVVVTACWQLVVAQQPATTNFYSVGVGTDDAIAYQWYGQTATPLSEMSDWSCLSQFCSADESGSTITSFGSYYTFVIGFDGDVDGKFFRFKSSCGDLSADGSCEKTPNGDGTYTYMYALETYSGTTYAVLQGGANGTTLYDLALVTREEKVPGQTRPYLTDGTVGTQYYCELTYDDGVGEAHVDSERVTYVGKLGHFHCTCGSEACSGEGHDALALWLPWDGTTTLPDKAGHWVLTNDVSLAATWQPADGTFLCLNGHAVTLDDATMPTVSVAEGVAITVTDCTGDGAFSGPATAGFESAGDLTLVNVAVSGCEVGVNVTKGNLTLVSVAVSDCSTGVNVTKGKLTVGGTASVTGNTVNVKLASGRKLAISEMAPLAAGAQIVVTTEQGLDEGCAVPFTDNGGVEDVAYFIPSDRAARVRVGDSGLELFIPVTVNPAEVAGAMFEVYANSKKVAKDASGYVVPTNATVTVIYTVTDDANAFAGGDDTWMTSFEADGVQTSAVPAAPALYWVDEPEFRFDASFTTNEQGIANYVVTHPDQLLPIAYSTNNWDKLEDGVNVSLLYEGPTGDSKTFITASVTNGFYNWTPAAKDFGRYSFGAMSLNSAGSATNWLDATVLYTTNFNLTVAQSEGGTLAAYTNAIDEVASVGADSWPLALVDAVKLVVTPANDLWAVAYVATNGVPCGDIQDAEASRGAPVTNAFTMPLAAVAVTAGFRYVGVELKAETVEHATMKYYTNGVEVAETEGTYVVVTNASACVVYTAEGGYYFNGGVKAVTNVLDTAKNPATMQGDLPQVLEPVAYRAPVYKEIGGIVSPTNGIEKWETLTNWLYTVVEDATETVTWNAGWYVVTNEVTLSAGANCAGEVHLILADGAKLTAKGGNASAGIGVMGKWSLTIYAQTAGTGQLEAQGNSDSAGIGGDCEMAGMNITINGGTVTAKGDGSGAGIGGGKGCKGQNIRINGGKVKATAGSGCNNAIGDGDGATD